MNEICREWKIEINTLAVFSCPEITAWIRRVRPNSSVPSISPPISTSMWKPERNKSYWFLNHESGIAITLVLLNITQIAVINEVHKYLWINAKVLLTIGIHGFGWKEKVRHKFKMDSIRNKSTNLVWLDLYSHLRVHQRYRLRGSRPRPKFLSALFSLCSMRPRRRPSASARSRNSGSFLS